METEKNATLSGLPYRSATPDFLGNTIGNVLRAGYEFIRGDFGNGARRILDATVSSGLLVLSTGRDLFHAGQRIIEKSFPHLKRGAHRILTVLANFTKE